MNVTVAGSENAISAEQRKFGADYRVSLINPTGAPKHFISVIEDVSEQKRTRDALQTIAAATAGRRK